jgi:hypothetical protein
MTPNDAESLRGAEVASALLHTFGIESFRPLQVCSAICRSLRRDPCLAKLLRFAPRKRLFSPS